MSELFFIAAALCALLGATTAGWVLFGFGVLCWIIAVAITAVAG
ncbi:hypothetical protein [Kribbella sandramycini]|uniref:Type IV secretory pathway TrbD component n=1 Tax=Kribbella sandramycini TaxID=60450 RepID=A0A841S418_9ACTN|nr:hypothetical protein [Kribbella sandramycini]MBB6564410.1 type IV secretory pathway TrbD component [Kribbella sandramycini]